MWTSAAREACLRTERRSVSQNPALKKSPSKRRPFTGKIVPQFMKQHPETTECLVVAIETDEESRPEDAITFNTA